ncbi:zinc finger protein 561-like [Homarus americanus]|uniref:Longitudinals lacking protein-like 21 n=1 Tax=Homarus americanus TaxID=6706 RepID=A0A8J5JI22_HOMAM|nr:zinc finger protein 561-like [Homarus americanus]KAG7158747.1 Longitudinals lacking protein-like 21 [Homarus americanus]
MTEEFVQLKWNTHKSIFLENLSGMRDKQIFTDVTLSCGDQFYPAHRLVLSSCSTFLAQALGVANCRSPVLLLHGIEQTTLEQLLMFMYDGQVTISRSNLPSLLKAAQWLGVKGLESTYDNFSDLSQFSGEPHHSHEEATGSPFRQLWRQLISAVANNREDSGNSESVTNVLQQVARKIVEQGNTLNNNMIISNVASLDPNIEIEDDFTEMKPNAGVEQVGHFSSDDKANFLPSPFSLGSIPEDFLDVQVNSSIASEYSFEGWDDATDLNKSEILLKLKKKTLTNEVEIDPTYLSSEAPGGEVGKENVECEETNTKRILRCKHCKRTFKVRVELAKHLRLHHDSQQKFCFSCNKEFVTAKKFNLHMKLHGSDSLYTCKLCDFITHNKRTLGKHIRTHKNEDSGSVQTSAQEEALKFLDKHLMTEINPPERVLPSKTVKVESQEELDQHTASDCAPILIKTGGHRCSLCTLMFTRKRSLTDHMCRHTGIYPFCCSYCSFKCTRNGTLQLHVKKRHPDV